LKKQLGQFYTKKAYYITQDLMSIFPSGSEIVDPFCGEWDLLNLIENGIGYDIDPKNSKTIKQDTLTNPPNYKNKWVITNPPYLAKNKNKDKTLYNTYQTDDLYKASLLSIIGCEGGVIIVPVNFFSSEDDKIRQSFLSEYEVIKVNVFEEQVFNDTTYTVCAFSFIKKKNIKQDMPFKFFPSQKEHTFSLNKKEGYRIGYEVYNLSMSKIKISRLVREEQQYKSNLFLYAIDTGNEKGKIRLELKDHYIGKQTDRAFATLVFSEKLSKEQEIYVMNKFNETIEIYRNKYHNMFLTNYRNSTSSMARKRIGFNLAYRIISHLLSK
jgi:hypothetical protein